MSGHGPTFPTGEPRNFMEAIVHDAADRNAQRGWRARLATAFGVSAATITKMIQKTCNPSSDRQCDHALARIGLDHAITSLAPADLLGGEWESFLLPDAGDPVARAAVADAFDIVIGGGPSEPLVLTNDDEARAIDVLAGLSEGARCRVLRYAAERWSK